MKPEPQRILDTLEFYFPKVEPFLDSRSPYTLLIAILLSCQSTDERVNRYTKELFLLADSPEKMVQIPFEELQEKIKPIGLYRKKARAILDLSQHLLDRFEGQVPSTLEELLSLPGVGRKTALVLLSQGFGVPTFPVDTHILRLSLRWGLTEHRDPRKVEEDLKAHFPEECWSKLHLQMILAGRTFCRSRPHDPTQCPICSRTSTK